MAADPTTVNGQRVVGEIAEWRVVDRWWTDTPIDRTYKEVELEDGSHVAICKEGESDWVLHSETRPKD